jgi:uncharacterized protein (DUF3820 family)
VKSLSIYTKSIYIVYVLIDVQVCTVQPFVYTMYRYVSSTSLFDSPTLIEKKDNFTRESNSTVGHRKLGSLWWVRSYIFSCESGVIDSDESGALYVYSGESGAIHIYSGDPGAVYILMSQGLYLLWWVRGFLYSNELGAIFTMVSQGLYIQYSGESGAIYTLVSQGLYILWWVRGYIYSGELGTIYTLVSQGLYILWWVRCYIYSGEWGAIYTLVRQGLYILS